MDIRVSKDLVGIVEFLEYLATLDKAVTQELKEVLVTLVTMENLDTQVYQVTRELKVYSENQVIPAWRVRQDIQGLEDIQDILELQVTLELRGNLDTQVFRGILDTVVMKVLQGTPDYLDILVTKESQDIQDIRVSLVIRDQRE